MEINTTITVAVTHSHGEPQQRVAAIHTDTVIRRSAADPRTDYDQARAALDRAYARAQKQLAEYYKS